MRNQRITCLIGVVVLVGAACSGAATTAPTETTAASPAAVAAVTPTATATPTSTATPIRTPIASPTATPTQPPTRTTSTVPTAVPALTQAPAAGVRCAETDNATPSATVQWDEVMGPEATIKAGEAVDFVTTGYFPSVTEWGTNGKPAPHPCIDKRIGQDAGPMQVVVTFYKAGDYNITCRRMPNVMHTVVHVR